MSNLLEHKNAIFYGAGGGIGSGVARAFAREGAHVLPAGRTAATLDAVASDIRAAGGQAEVAVVDALEGQAVTEHVRAVVDGFGSLDVSFNLISRGDVQGVPLLEMATADVTRPVLNGLTSGVITTRAAARRMSAQASGVILGSVRE